MSGAITDISGIQVGTAEDAAALTGCTVVLAENGAVCGVDVRGGAPGTRETDLLAPVNSIEKVHAVLLTGGSAYGLEAAQGVMQYLEEKGIGFFTGKTVVPIVPAAVLFDLNVGSFRVRPDKNMGYQACLRAGRSVAEGCHGAGCGATVGKIGGFGTCTKSGQGTWAERLPNGLVVGALAAVNAFGEVVDPDSGAILAGVRSQDGRGFIPTIEVWKKSQEAELPPPGTNTTLAIVAVNARLTKAQAQKVAQMAHDGLARTIRPVHTMMDGDTVFAMATGEMEADVNLIGYLAQEALARAVVRAVTEACSLGELKAARDIG